MTPQPSSTRRFSWARILLVDNHRRGDLANRMALLANPIGWQNTYTQMGGFFTKAALLTFWRAYAVLPYVISALSNTIIG